MELPWDLREALQERAEGREPSRLIRDANELSARYRNAPRTGKRLLGGEGEALAYAVARMPATYGAVATALAWALAGYGGGLRTLLDVGAGTGAASWAACSLLKLEAVTCLEREQAMLAEGRTLMERGDETLRSAAWLKRDLTTGLAGLRAELVIASYVLNEMEAEERKRCALRLWEATEGLLLIVEPGTPAGFAGLRDIRELLLSRGAHLVAPCPGEGACPLPEGEWCHCTCRIARSGLHRRLKGGEAPYEDEKFSYMAFARGTMPERPAGRALRHPRIESGRVTLEMFMRDGPRMLTLTKRDGEAYKKARKLRMGDGFDPLRDGLER